MAVDVLDKFRVEHLPEPLPMREDLCTCANGVPCPADRAWQRKQRAENGPPMRTHAVARSLLERAAHAKDRLSMEQEAQALAQANRPAWQTPLERKRTMHAHAQQVRRWTIIVQQATARLKEGAFDDAG